MATETVDGKCDTYPRERVCLLKDAQPHGGMIWEEHARRGSVHLSVIEVREQGVPDPPALVPIVKETGQCVYGVVNVTVEDVVDGYSRMTIELVFGEEIDK